MSLISSDYDKITNNIYIGNMWACKNIINDSLKHNIIQLTHIISLIPQPTPIKDYIKSNNIIYYEHSFADSVDENIIEHFDIMSETIRKFLLEDHGTILVVCQAGKSRSVSIVILTLMQHYNVSFSDALELISSKRETQINRRFYIDLANYKKK